MNVVNSPQHGRLQGKSILLSASVPLAEGVEIHQRIEMSEAVEEAVVSLARAIFSEGGTLVFGAHPTVSPLVALVLREYLRPDVAERPIKDWSPEESGPKVEIYQSEAYMEHTVETMKRLVQQPGVNVTWVESLEGEVGDPDVRHRPQAPQSVRQMRREMIKRREFAAMVCVGGTEGLEEEMEIFHEHWKKLPVYLLESTGGFTKELAQDTAHRPWLRLPERGVRERIEAFWVQEYERSEKPGRERVFALPYAYIAQKIVAEIIEPGESGEQRVMVR